MIMAVISDNSAWNIYSLDSFLNLAFMQWEFNWTPLYATSLLYEGTL